MVHGAPVDPLPAALPDQAGRAAGPGEVRRVHDAPRPGAVSGPAEESVQLLGPRLAVRRRPAPGRGPPPADAPDGRTVRAGAAEPERRAGPRGGAVGGWLQGRQAPPAGP